MNSPVRWLFEIVVAAYGPSPLLAETLRSILAALPTPGPRVTVLDDASPTDVVRLIAEPLAPRVSFRRNERNLGVSGAFNVAADLSQSEYTILVGPDDRLLSSASDVYQHAIEQHRGAAAIQPGVITIDEAGQEVSDITDGVKRLITPRQGRSAGQSLAVSLLLGDWTYNPALAWRTDFVRQHRFDENLHTAMDLDLLLRLAFAGESVAVSTEPAFEYRRHEGAVSSGNRGLKRLGEELRIHHSAKDTATQRGWRRAR